MSDTDAGLEEKKRLSEHLSSGSLEVGHSFTTIFVD